MEEKWLGALEFLNDNSTTCPITEVEMKLAEDLIKKNNNGNLKKESVCLEESPKEKKIKEEMEKSRNKLLALINEGILYIYFQGTTGLTDEKANKIVRRIIDIKNLILEYNLYEAIDSLNECIEKLVDLGKFYKDIKFFDLANAISDSALFWMKGLPGNLKKEDVAKTYALYNATTKVLKNKEELGTTYDFFENVDTEKEAKTIVQNFEKSAIKCIYIPKNDSTNKSFDIYFVRNKNQDNVNEINELDNSSRGGR